MKIGNPGCVPREVRALATRLGARPCPDASTVTLTQHGSLRDALAGRWRRFTARQRIHVAHTEFEWRASMGPFGAISVVDALKDKEPRLEARLFRCIPLAHAADSAAVKGELMRYLAELPWAPDAILANHELEWAVLDEAMIRVGATLGAIHAEVKFALDADGRVMTASAHDRPRREGNGFVERPWRSRFDDYRQYRRRLLPFRAEVGWILDGKLFTAWNGEIDNWAIQ